MVPFRFFFFFFVMRNESQNRVCLNPLVPQTLHFPIERVVGKGNAVQKWKMVSWDVVSKKGYCLFLTLFLPPSEDFLSVSSWTCSLFRHTNSGLIFVKGVAEIFVWKSMNVQTGCPK